MIHSMSLPRTASNAAPRRILFPLRKAASTPFFDLVNERMKRDSPYKYDQYLKGKKNALEKLKWKLEDRNRTIDKWYARKRGDVNAVAKNLESSYDTSISYPARSNDQTIVSDISSSHLNADLGKTSPFNTLVHQSASQPTKSSIFSTIAANIQALESNTNSNNPSSILSDLFQSPKESTQPEKVRNKAIIYHPDHWETYQSIMTSVLLDEKTQKILSKISRDSRGGQIVELVKEWLLSDERVVEKEVVGDRWRGLDEVWREGWSHGASTIFAKGNEKVDTFSVASIADDTLSPEFEDEHEVDANIAVTEAHGSKLLSELKLQQDIFMNKLLSSKPDLLDAFAPESKEHNEQHSQAEKEALAIAEITHQFHKVTIRIMSFLGRYCAKRSRSDPMHVAWYKIKESGLRLPPDSISTFLYVVTTMGGSSLGFGSGSLLFSSKSTSGDNDLEEEEENALLVPEEVATYHDLLCRPTESSVSLRVKTLASKGDTETAEELLESFKVSDN